MDNAIMLDHAKADEGVSELVIQGSIVDSWLERRGDRRTASSVVFQVAPRGSPRDIWIVEASPALVSDTGWLEDLGENLCHGSPIAATGRMSDGGCITATTLRLER